jgi:hypothetical protein
MGTFQVFYVNTEYLYNKQCYMTIIMNIDYMILSNVLKTSSKFINLFSLYKIEIKYK